MFIIKKGATKVRNKKLTVFILLIIASSLFATVVYAAPTDAAAKGIGTIVNMATAILNTQITLPHPGDVGGGEKVALWAVIAVFAMLFAPAYSISKRLHFFKHGETFQKGPAIAFSIALVGITIFSTGVTEFVVAIVGGGFWLIVMVLVIVLLFYGLGAAAEHIGKGYNSIAKAVGDVGRESTELTRVQHLEAQEEAAIGHMRGLAANVRSHSTDIWARLKHLKAELLHVPAVSSEQAKNIVQSEIKQVAGLIRGEVPAQYRQLSQIQIDEQNVRKFEVEIIQALNKARQDESALSSDITSQKAKNATHVFSHPDMKNRNTTKLLKVEGTLARMATRISRIEALVHSGTVDATKIDTEVKTLKGLIERFENGMKGLETHLLGGDTNAAVQEINNLLPIEAEIHSLVTAVNTNVGLLTGIHSAEKSNITELTTTVNNIRHVIGTLEW